MTLQNAPLKLFDLNDCATDAFEQALASIFENASWVASAVVGRRPFDSLTRLHAEMVSEIRAVPVDRLDAFLRGHPRLSPETLRKGTTAESTAEQVSAGISRLDAQMHARLDALNASYEAKFGFPFILAIRNASLATLLASFERRMEASLEAERSEAVLEIAAISWMRLLDRIVPAPTGSVSTHVLDTARAKPASGLGVELWRREPDGTTRKLEAFSTNANGASSRDVLGGGGLKAGTYEWHFDTPSYFAAQGYATPARSFLGKVVVAFTVWNPEEHFHVPLLLTPGSYMVYRGS